MPCDELAEDFPHRVPLHEEEQYSQADSVGASWNRWRSNRRLRAFGFQPLAAILPPLHFQIKESH